MGSQLVVLEMPLYFTYCAVVRLLHKLQTIATLRRLPINVEFISFFFSIIISFQSSVNSYTI